MPWGALAGALVGAGASIFGSKKSADATRDAAAQADPYRVAQAHAMANNVDRNTPFGSVTYVHHEGNPNDLTDDRWSVNQTYSSQMQQLLDALTGQAGRATATFESNMPVGLHNRFREVYGSRVPGAHYTPSRDGFGQDRRPYGGQVLEGFNPANFNRVGERNSEPYTPYSPQGSDSYQPFTPGSLEPENVDPMEPGTTDGQSQYSPEIMDWLNSPYVRYQPGSSVVNWPSSRGLVNNRALSELANALSGVLP